MDRWFHGESDMDVGLDPAYCMEVGAGSFDDLVSKKFMEVGFDALADHWQIVFRVPRDVEVYFGVDSFGHIDSWLKPGARRTLKRPDAFLSALTTP
jgi:hypothetical protein